MGADVRHQMSEDGKKLKKGTGIFNLSAPDMSEDGKKLKKGTGIFNLSSRQLTADEEAVLQKGLSFIPTRRQPPAQLISELKKWERLMRLREYWAENGKKKKRKTKIPTGNTRRPNELLQKVVTPVWICI